MMVTSCHIFSRELTVGSRIYTKMMVIVDLYRKSRSTHSLAGTQLLSLLISQYAIAKILKRGNSTQINKSQFMFHLIKTRFQIAPNNPTAILPHRFNSRGYRTYLNFTISLRILY
jgi:hypothetical protein